MAGEPRHRTGRSLLVGVAIGSPSGVNFHRSKYSPNMSARLPRVRCDAVALGVNISVSAPFRSAVPYWFDHVPVFTPRSSVGSRAGALLWPRGSQSTPRLQPLHSQEAFGSCSIAFLVRNAIRCEIPDRVTLQPQTRRKREAFSNFRFNF
jgi:hypothetical protein